MMVRPAVGRFGPARNFPFKRSPPKLEQCSALEAPTSLPMSVRRLIRDKIMKHSNGTNSTLMPHGTSPELHKVVRTAQSHV